MPASAADQILAAIGGGLSGGAKGYAFMKEMEQKDRAIDNRTEVARLQGEIRMMLESMKEGGRNERYAAPSGNVLTQQAGATERTGITVDGAMDRAELGAETTRRGQDITQQLGIRRDGTTRRGQDFGFTLGGMRDQTARRGQDIGATTTRRGQDITEALGISTEAGRNTRATDANTLRQREYEQRIQLEREKLKKRDLMYQNLFPGSAPPVEVKEGVGTGKPTAEPIEVKETPTRTTQLPVTLRSPEARADQRRQLVGQLSAAIQRFKTATTPAAKDAARVEVAAIRARIDKKGQ